ncbi:MAG: hypothetical protein WC959_12500 [Kiritimatiellales bacterium]
MKKTVYLITLAAAVAIFADTRVKLSGGQLIRAWDNDLPSESNPGVIDIKGTWQVPGSFDGWVGTQKSGVIAGALKSITFRNGAKWRLEGGQILCRDGSTGKAHVRVGDSDSAGELIMTGGEIIADTYFDVGFNSLFRQSGGSVTGVAGCRFSHGGKIFIEGGIGTFSRMALASPDTQVEFSGGTWKASKPLEFAGSTTPNTVIRFAEGNGSLSVGGIEMAGSGCIDFVTGSKGTFAVKGYKEADFEKLWDRGKLKFNGSSRGAFSDIFAVEKDTLSLK